MINVGDNLLLYHINNHILKWDHYGGFAYMGVLVRRQKKIYFFVGLPFCKGPFRRAGVVLKKTIKSYLSTSPKIGFFLWVSDLKYMLVVSSTYMKAAFKKRAHTMRLE